MRPNLKSLILERSGAYRLFQKVIARPNTMIDFRDRFFPEVQRHGCRVLDLGCGPATFLDSLDDPIGIDYTGFDPNPEYIETAKHRFPNSRFLVGTSESLATSIQGPFDLALLFGVIHHLDDDQASLLVQFGVERLRPGGKLVTIDPVICSRQNPIARLLAKSDRGKFVGEPGRYRQIVSSHIKIEEAVVLSGQLRVPYNHFVTVSHT